MIKLRVREIVDGKPGKVIAYEWLDPKDKGNHPWRHSDVDYPDKVWEGVAPYAGVREQFTGLVDKNGTEIYVGDKVRALYTNWGSQHLGTAEQQLMSLEEYRVSISEIGSVVFWNCLFGLNFGHGFAETLFMGAHGEKEVIGSVHGDKEESDES